jgi:hypothetical protein
MNEIINCFFKKYLILYTNILCFILIIILIDAIVIDNNYRILQINYDNLVKYNNINTDINVIKNKIDFLTSKINSFYEDKPKVELEIKNKDFDYKLARKSLISSKSLSFKKSPKNKYDIPINTQAGEIITISI